MKKGLLLIIACTLGARLLGSTTGVQRYHDEIFSEVKVDSVAYCIRDGWPLLMDVYRPEGDTAPLRPLVLFAHGGSFMHGNRHSERMMAICHELAARGYVAASIDYRLTKLRHMLTRASAYREIMKAVADGRASVAWFVKDIDRGNTYRIDKSKIFFGGNSAGAILAEQLVFIDSAAQCKKVLRKAVCRYLPDSTALPAHALRGIISLAGAALDTGLIGPSQPALLHIQGDADHIVPYKYKRALYGLAPVRMAGLGASRPRYNSQRLDFTEYVFKGGGHTPWDWDNDMFHTVMQQMADFLQKEIAKPSTPNTLFLNSTRQ